MRRTTLVFPLVPLLLSACAEGITGPPNGTPVVPSVGDTLTFNVEPRCAANFRDERDGRVIAVTNRSIVVLDLASPSGGLSDAEYAAIGQSFDQVAWPVVTQNFGTPADLDGNDRIIAFFTPAVNQMSDPNASSFIAGFFWPGDLFPRQNTPRLQACPNSNEAEIFYMRVPDPNGQFGQQVSGDDIRRTSLTTMGHELQHLVNASRRLYINESVAFSEEIWLNEGLSHIAEELMFFEVTGLGPGQNLRRQTIGSQAVIDHFNRFQAGNLLRLAQLLESPVDPASSLVNTQAPLASRGGIWGFLRYAADRQGGSQQALWRSLVDTDLAGLENLAESFSGSPFDLMRDWTVALFASDTLAVDANFEIASWDLRDLYDAWRVGDNKLFPNYPLETRDLTDSAVSIPASTAMYVRGRVAAGAEAEVTLTSGSGPPPDALRLSVVNVATGGVFHATGAEAGTVTLQAGNQETDFLLILLHASGVSGALLNILVNTNGANLLASASHQLHEGPRASLTGVAFGGVEGDGPALQQDHRFHLELHERAARELAPLVAGARRVYRAGGFEREVR